jgi:type I restriction enzyme S subunit
MTVESLITQHIDTWTSTIKTQSTSGRGSRKKLELYGVKKLRELILELAIRGKLVPQDLNDEPASVLLERIAAEKAQLVKEKKIKKPKKLPELDPAEHDYLYPKVWSTVRLGDIVTLENGDRSKNYPNKSVLVESGIPFVNAGHLVRGRIEKSEMTFITEERFELLRAGKFKNGDILFCLRGSLGKSALVENFDSGAIASSLVIVRADKSILPKYLMLYFDSPISNQNIKLYDNGTAQPNLSAADLAKFVLAVPSTNEQHRIVAKVDELMALCDQLEQQTEASIEVHQLLVSTLLNTLTNSADADELMENWARISDHFDTLFTTEASIDQLKQTILQLAVMGKLVPQDPNDEPASVLLERIAEEKAQLIKEKVYQKSSKLKPMNKGVYYPNGWVSVQTGQVCPSIVPNRDRPKSFTGNIPWVTLPSFPKQSFYLDNNQVELSLTSSEVEKYSARLIPERSVLMSCVGRFGLTAINLTPVTSNQQVHAFIVLNGLLPEYLSMVIKVEGKLLENVATSTTIAYLNKTNCESIQFGLPPTNEQHLIIEKVKELFVFCDQLKARLKESQTIQLHLTDAIVEQAI